MTCKDCIHYEKCKVDYFNKTRVAPYTLPWLWEPEKDWEHCGVFKDKSSFVELSCKVGDEVFVISDTEEIDKTKVVYHSKHESVIEQQCEEYWVCYPFGWYFRFERKQFLNSYTKELIDQPIADVYEDYCSFCSCNDYKVETRKAFTVAVNKIKGYKSHPAKKYGATVRVFKPCNDKCNDF